MFTNLLRRRRTSPQHMTKPAVHRRFRPGLDVLEDRLAPASTITVIPGAAGTGSLDSFLSPSDGTILASDGGSSAHTVSAGALSAVNGNVNISVTASTSIAFNDLGGALNLQTSAGRSVTFSATGGTIDFANTTNLLRTSGGDLVFSAQTSLTTSQLDTNGGDLSLSSATVTVARTSTTNNGDILATANVFNLGSSGSLNAGAGRVTIRPFSANRPINLGTETTGSLSLTDAEIDDITAGVLEIGRSNAGAITISGAIAPVSVGTLALVTLGTVTEAAGGSLAVNGLRVSAGLGVTLESVVNDVSAIAANFAGAGGNFLSRV